MPRKPPREFWRPAIAELEAKGFSEERARKIAGAEWFHKMSVASKHHYDLLRLRRESRK